MLPPPWLTYTCNRIYVTFVCSESELFHHMSLRLPLPMSAGIDNDHSVSEHSQFSCDQGRQVLPWAARAAAVLCHQK